MKFFRVAKEGVTADGRTIKAEHLEQMAKNYDPKKYAARVWIEHIRTIVPDGLFKAYGDVVELKTEKDADGKTVLLARIDPTDELRQINKNRQKLYSSVEIDTSFSDTGEAYLVGLAVTDSPASLGTERLMFSVVKQQPEHLFSAYDAFEMSVDDGILGQVKSLLDKFGRQQAYVADKTAVSEAAGLSDGFGLVIEHFSGQLDEQMSKQQTKFDAALAKNNELFTRLQAEFAELRENFSKMQDALDNTTATPLRPLATGTSHFGQTDC